MLTAGELKKMLADIPDETQFVVEMQHLSVDARVHLKVTGIWVNGKDGDKPTIVFVAR